MILDAVENVLKPLVFSLHSGDPTINETLDVAVLELKKQISVLLNGKKKAILNNKGENFSLKSTPYFSG